MEVPPVQVRQLLHRTGQQLGRQLGLVARQLQGQSWADALVGLAQGLRQGDRDQAQPPPPVGERLGGPGGLALGRRRWQVDIAAANRPDAGLLLAHLTGGAADPSLAI